LDVHADACNLIVQGLVKRSGCNNFQEWIIKLPKKSSGQLKLDQPDWLLLLCCYFNM